MKRNTLCIGLAAALLSTVASAQSIGLAAAFERALVADPAIQASAMALQAGREKAVQGRSLFRPQVSLSSSVTAMTSHSESALPPAFAALAQPNTSGNIRQAAVQVVQPLINAGVAASQSQLSRQSEGAELAWAAARQDLMMRVTEATLALVAARHTLQVVEAEAAALAQQRERAQARLDVGMGKLTDLQEARARLDGALAQQVSARSALAQRMAQFEALTGAPAVGVAGLSEASAMQAPQPDRLEGWQDRAMARNSRLLAKQIEVAVAMDETQRHGLQARPTLDLVGSYTVQNKGGDLSLLVSADRQRTATVGVRLNVPLFTGGNLDSREREAAAKARQAELELVALQRDVRLQVQDAFLAVTTGIARLDALQAAMLSARTALDATAQGRDVGLRTQLDVLDAQQRWFATRLDLVQARVDLLLGRARLAWAAGELDEAALGQLDIELAR